MNGLPLNFSLQEVLAFLGLAQVIYILVFMGMRLNRIERAVIPVMFYVLLACLFFFIAAEARWSDLLQDYIQIEWMLWTLLSPLSALLILQIASVTKKPALYLWGVFLLVPMAYMTAYLLGLMYGEQRMWLYVATIIVGSLSLLIIWSERHFMAELKIRKNGRDRFWLIIALIMLNVGLLITNYLSINNDGVLYQIELIRNILAITFVYIVSTSIFRIYPQAVSIAPSPQEKDKKDDFLNDKEIDVAMKIENLLHLDKVYQEPSYKRSDLARELVVTDSHLSRIVNIYFEKSVPQLLNSYRVEDAKYLLKDTKADISTIAEEAGFNSIATFNRVFKEIAGKTPTEFREKPF